MLLAKHEIFAADPAAAAASAALGRHLCQVLTRLEPVLLGLYWPQRSEFNAVAAIAADNALANLPAALPFARRSPVRMDFRAWSGQDPTIRDDCGIPTSDGALVVPDVVVLPCVGYTRDGYRLGHGGGYFDRWMASHPSTTAIGVAGSFAEIPPGAFEPQDHDVPLMLVVTENGVVGA